MLAAHVTAVTVPEKVFVLKPVLFFREKTEVEVLWKDFSVLSHCTVYCSYMYKL